MITILALLGGCATRNRGSAGSGEFGGLPEGSVFLTDETPVRILPPGAIEMPLDELQRLSARYGDKTFTMTAFLQADETGIRMLGMGDMGQELFDLDFSAGATRFSGIAGTGSIRPEYMVMDLQLVYYRADVIERRLGDAGLDFIVSEDGGIQHRTVRFNGADIIEITRSARRVTLENRLRGYRYTITRENGNG